MTVPPAQASNKAEVVVEEVERGNPDAGTARVRRLKGRAMQSGAKSPHTLYDPQVASFSMEGYDVTAARGFIDLFGLPMKVASQAKKWRASSRINPKSPRRGRGLFRFTA